MASFSTLKIGDKSFKLLYDFNILCDAEESTGCNLLAALQRQGACTATELRGLVFALTRQKHPKLTVEECGSLVNIKTLVDIQYAIFEACAAAVSEEYADAWRAEMAKPGPVTTDTEEEIEDESPEGGHISEAQLQGYRDKTYDLTMQQIWHVKDCPTCLKVLDAINVDRMKAA